jgi:hypothetical protein
MEHCKKKSTDNPCHQGLLIDLPIMLFNILDKKVLAVIFVIHRSDPNPNKPEAKAGISKGNQYFDWYIIHGLFKLRMQSTKLAQE